MKAMTYWARRRDDGLFEQSFVPESIVTVLTAEQIDGQIDLPVETVYLDGTLAAAASFVPSKAIPSRWVNVVVVTQ